MKCKNCGCNLKDENQYDDDQVGLISWCHTCGTLEVGKDTDYYGSLVHIPTKNTGA